MPCPFHSYGVVLMLPFGHHLGVCSASCGSPGPSLRDAQQTGAQLVPESLTRCWTSKVREPCCLPQRAYQGMSPCPTADCAPAALPTPGKSRPLTRQPSPSDSPFPCTNQFVSTEGRELQSKQIMHAHRVPGTRGGGCCWRDVPSLPSQSTPHPHGEKRCSAPEG